MNFGLLFSVSVFLFLVFGLPFSLILFLCLHASIYFFRFLYLFCVSPFLISFFSLLVFLLSTIRFCSIFILCGFRFLLPFPLLFCIWVGRCRERAGVGETEPENKRKN